MPPPLLAQMMVWHRAIVDCSDLHTIAKHFLVASHYRKYTKKLTSMGYDESGRKHKRKHTRKYAGEEGDNLPDVLAITTGEGVDPTS